jgi:hypothetical protein
MARCWEQFAMLGIIRGSYQSSLQRAEPKAPADDVPPGKRTRRQTGERVVLSDNSLAARMAGPIHSLDSSH